MSDETPTGRIDALERRIDAVEDTLERYRKQHALLLTEVDVDALDEPSCPECGEGTLTKNAGISWAKATCRECETTWVLDS